MALSYYEQLTKDIRSSLYPEGIKLPFWVMAVRNADKEAAAKRRKLIRMAKKVVK